MSKKKNFRDWNNEEYVYENEEPKFKRKDNKRYDKKKANIQNARKRKNKLKNSYFDGV